MEINPDLLEDMNKRKAKVLDLMDRTKSNELVDDTKAFEFFIHISQVTDLYKYTGDLSFLTSHLDEEIATDLHWFKEFLEWYADPDNTITVYQVILSSLS